MAEIFLSHSGSQKPFVVCLNKALQAAGHSPFLDVISLPKAEPFPPNIEEALRNCKLGVVVLSEEFMTSHWPMRELALLHHNPSTKILPLFYNLSPHDLKSERNLSRWRPKWKELGEKHGLDTSQWEKVVGLLPSLNGELLLPGSNETSYIDKVVKEICRLLPLSPHYDVLDVNGASRLCEVIMSKFEIAQLACKSISCACTIALHGVGGAGKTTICKLMANAYSSHYPGKSLLLEFPYDGNMKSITKECRKLLRQCTNASNEHVLSRAHSLYEMQQLARDGLVDFEGVDEERRIVVHDLYLELAKREAFASPRFFLGYGQEINNRDWSLVKRVVLPKGMEENLVKVIEQNCPRLQVLIAIGSWNYIQHFKGELKLGAHMGALRILILQNMFLDISTSIGGWCRSNRPTGSWFRRVGRQEGRPNTGGGMHVDDGWRGCVGRLAWLELVWCKWRHAVEAVYDMDRLEVLILNDCEGPWKKWSKLGHGCGGLEEFYVQGHALNDRNGANSVRSLSKLKKLRLVWVPNLKALAVGANVQRLEVHHCQDLEEICSLGPLQDLITQLFVANCRLLKAITGFNGAYTQLQKLKVSGCEALEEIPGLQGLINLKHLSIEHCPRVRSIAERSCCPLVNAVHQLTQIEIWECRSLEEIPAISGLINLKGLDISYCPRLKALLLDLRDAVQLQEIRLESCESLEEIPTLHGLINLKRLVIQYCPRLKAIPNWSGAAQLDHIDVSKHALTNPERVWASSPRTLTTTVTCETSSKAWPSIKLALSHVLCISHK